MPMSTAAWNYALSQTAKGPIGASAVINSAPVAPRPPLPSYPQPVFRTPIPSNHYASGARGVEFKGSNLPGGGITRGATFAAPGAAGVGAAGTGTGLGFAATAGAVAAAAAAGVAIGEGINGVIGNTYPGDRNARQYFGDLLFPPSAITTGDGQETKRGGTAAPPFQGGQCQGDYLISGTLSLLGQGAYTLNFGPQSISGPIKGIRTILQQFPNGGKLFHLQALNRDNQWNTLNSVGGGEDASSTYTANVVLANGQPDLCGNLAPPDETTKRVSGFPTLPTERGTEAPSIAPRKTDEPWKFAPPPLPGSPISPVKPGDPAANIPGLDIPTLPGLPFGIPAPSGNNGDTKIGNPADPSTWKQKPPTEPPTPPGSPPKCPCNLPVLDGLADLGKKVDNLAGPAGEAVSTAAIMDKLKDIQDFAAKAWESTRIQKVIDLLTLVAALHNVTILSREVGETMGYAIDQGLQAMGVKLKDEEGQQIDFNSLVGKEVKEFLVNLVGEDVYNETRTTYLKANRILSTGSQIIWTIRSIGDSTHDLMEWVGQHTGKIGNALKRFGVVGDRAYPWMSENPQAQNKVRQKFQKIIDNLETAEDTASAFASASSNVLEITQEVSELREQKENFKNAVVELQPKTYNDNEPVKQNRENEAEAAQSPVVSGSDTDKGG